LALGSIESTKFLKPMRITPINPLTKPKAIKIELSAV
jgi:hypothetical protein